MAAVHPYTPGALADQVRPGHGGGDPGGEMADVHPGPYTPGALVDQARPGHGDSAAGGPGGRRRP